MYEALSLALHRELAHEVTDEGVAAKGADVRASNGEHLAEESLEENFISEAEHYSNFLEGKGNSNGTCMKLLRPPTSLRFDVSLMRKKLTLPRYLLILAPGILERGVRLMAWPSWEAV